MGWEFYHKLDPLVKQVWADTTSDFCFWKTTRTSSPRAETRNLRRCFMNSSLQGRFRICYSGRMNEELKTYMDEQFGALRREVPAKEDLAAVRSDLVSELAEMRAMMVNKTALAPVEQRLADDINDLAGVASTILTPL